MTKCLLFWGVPFLLLRGTMIDVKGGTIAFRVSDEMVGFGMKTVNKDSFDYSCGMINDHSVKERFFASSTQHDLFNPP